jgi:hypothetical protein
MTQRSPIADLSISDLLTHMTHMTYMTLLTLKFAYVN